MPLRNAEEEELVRVGPGTPSGEVFRRYWLPVEVSTNLGGGRGGFTGARNPIRLRVLGEDLVLFRPDASGHPDLSGRDASGSPGLLAEHCSHRGTSLYYGRVEEESLRCLYHGWAYDREGNVVDTPAEPPDSSFKHTVKHRAYPCVEVGGLIFAYLGPPDKKPLFPKYPQLFREDGVRVTGNGGYTQQCNIFQSLHDNILDPWHGEIAHGWFKGRPPVRTMYYGPDGELATPWKVDRTPWGTRYAAIQATNKPGRYQYHETHTVWPSQRCIFRGGRSMKWAVPVDDYHTRYFAVDFFPLEGGEVPAEAYALMKRDFHIGHVEDLPRDWAEQVGAWWNLGHPWRQGNLWEDEVTQGTQGSAERHYLPNWEDWHLATSDRGLLLNREVWREQVERVRQGLDPLGVVRDPREERPVIITADDVYGPWEEVMRLYQMSAEERVAIVGDTVDGLRGHASPAALAP